MQGSIFCIGDASPSTIASIKNDTDGIISFSPDEKALKLQYGSQAVDSNDVSFIIVAPTATDDAIILGDYAESLPTSVVFVVFECGAVIHEMNRPNSKHSLRIHRFVEMKHTSTTAASASSLSSSSVPSYVCDGVCFSSIRGVVIKHLVDMLTGWRNVNKLQNSTKKMSVYASTNAQQSETITESLMFPFNTRGKVKCNKIVVVSSECDKMSGFFDEHPLRRAELLTFVVLKPEQCAGNVDYNNRHSLVIHEIDFKEPKGVVATRITGLREASKRSGVDTFILIKVDNASATSVASATSYASATSVATNNLNCMVVSAGELSKSDWTAHVFTAIGAVEINRHRDYYGAIDKDEYKSALNDAQTVLFDSDITSESFVQVLNAE